MSDEGDAIEMYPSGELDFTDPTTFTDPRNHAAHTRADHALRYRIVALHAFGVVVPPRSVITYAGGNNPELWIDQAADYAEREARYQLVEALEKIERIEMLEVEERRRQSTVDVEDIHREARRILVQRQGERMAAEWEATLIAGEWFGEIGDDFDPDLPERQPCFLQIEPGSYAFPPGVHYLFGPRSSLKTWLAYFAGIEQIRQGKPFLVIDLEMDKQASMRRLYTLGLSTNEIGNGRWVYVHPSGAISDAARGQLVRRFAEEPPAFILIDSGGMATGASGLNSNDDSDMAQWALDVPFWMKAQWPEACILVIDHVPKSQAAGGATDPIGSQRIPRGGKSTARLRLRRWQSVRREAGRCAGDPDARQARATVR